MVFHTTFTRMKHFDNARNCISAKFRLSAHKSNFFAERNSRYVRHCKLRVYSTEMRDRCIKVRYDQQNTVTFSSEPSAVDASAHSVRSTLAVSDTRRAPWPACLLDNAHGTCQTQHDTQSYASVTVHMALSTLSLSDAKFSVAQSPFWFGVLVALFVT